MWFAGWWALYRGRDDEKRGKWSEFVSTSAVRRDIPRCKVGHALILKYRSKNE
jgi:hypothetical protein